MLDPIPSSAVAWSFSCVSSFMLLSNRIGTKQQGSSSIHWVDPVPELYQFIHFEKSFDSVVLFRFLSFSFYHYEYLVFSFGQSDYGAVVFLYDLAYHLFGDKCTSETSSLSHLISFILKRKTCHRGIVSFWIVKLPSQCGSVFAWVTSTSFPSSKRQCVPQSRPKCCPFDVEC